MSTSAQLALNKQPEQYHNIINHTLEKPTNNCVLPIHTIVSFYDSNNKLRNGLVSEYTLLRRSNEVVYGIYNFDTDAMYYRSPSDVIRTPENESGYLRIKERFAQAQELRIQRKKQVLSTKDKKRTLERETRNKGD